MTFGSTTREETPFRHGPPGFARRGSRPRALRATAFIFVGAARFELATSRTRTVRATKLRYAPSGLLERPSFLRGGPVEAAGE